MSGLQPCSQASGSPFFLGICTSLQPRIRLSAYKGNSNSSHETTSCSLGVAVGFGLASFMLGDSSRTAATHWGL